jgi:hypothetical protein
MKPYQIGNRCLLRTAARLTLGAVLLAAIGCHTAEGVKQDTKSALDATGKELQKGAAKIDGSDKDVSNKDVKKDAQSPK